MTLMFYSFQRGEKGMNHHKSWLSPLSNNKLYILFEVIPIQILLFIFWDFALMSVYTDTYNILDIIIGSLVFGWLFSCSIIILRRLLIMKFFGASYNNYVDVVKYISWEWDVYQIK